MTRRSAQVIAVICGLVLLIPALAAAAQSYIVQPGDTLWAIASRFGVSVDELISANRLPNPDALKLGQRLIIPGHSAPPTAQRQTAARRPAAAPPRPAAKSYLWHTVQAGDTLWTIASRYGTTVNAIIASNELRTPDALTLGQRLKVLVSAATPTPAPTAPASLRPAPPLRALSSNAIAPARLLPRSAIPSRGEKWASALQQVAVSLAGIRYRWGGTSPRGFDCSGFITYVMSSVGVRVPRTTYGMFASGRPVSRSQLQVGDVVFFQTVSRGPSHAGIYIGNNLFMHSSSGIGRVSITSLDYRYYKARFYGARRF